MTSLALRSAKRRMKEVAEEMAVAPVASDEESSENDLDCENFDDDAASETSSSSGAIGQEKGTFQWKYHELIKKCRKLEKKEGLSSDVFEGMTENIESAKRIFLENLAKPSRQSEDATTTVSKQETGATNFELCIAYEHTKIISEVLRSKTDSIGTCNQRFKLKDFIANLKQSRLCLEETAPNVLSYSPKRAAKFLSTQFAKVSSMVPPLVAVVGTFDKDAISVPKEKKPKEKFIRKKPENLDSALEEIAPPSKRPENQKLSFHVGRILQQHTRSQSKPTSLYEFILDPASLNKSIESLFNVAFLVHDGLAGIHKHSGSPLKDFGIEITPEKRTEQEEPPPKNQALGRKKTRNQYILSLSASMFKKLSQVARGEPVIPPYSTLEELDATGTQTSPSAPPTRERTKR